ncbi:polysaccharide deacetylase family protein [Shewanella sp. 4t3-1-2LB]|uniref:polysaccharide deacetylase family protein n=1 Tax=Shewanella sp. 4t3-1-2LB TaxID=2817682 RepID=UPI001A993288|nr:polysaccharide deacetylase family protein [Shewanella sp. 4t3-1-2LB]MBO1273288.1 polysaccharide deacetylase family protein [Shewanella sp. 4t3-1-2LB]
MNKLRLFKRLGIGVVLFLLLGVALLLLSRSRDFQLFGKLVSHIDTAVPVVALTFDDGPSAQYTPDVLATLAHYQVKATFFVTGREASQHSAMTKAIVAAGHQLGNHSWSHPRLVFHSYAVIANEIEQTDAVIREAGYRGPIYFRPPYGKKLLLLPWYLKQHQRVTVTWNVEADSDLGADADTIAQRVISEVKPGSIVLLHVMYASREASRAALPSIIEGLRAKGYRLVTMAELLQDSQP